MTNEQHPGGVAGQIIQERKHDNDGSPHTEAALSAAIGMHRELSREAQAILAENPEPFGFDEHAAYERGMRAGVLEMAHRLGLDLESEDAE